MSDFRINVWPDAEAVVWRACVEVKRERGWKKLSGVYYSGSTKAVVIQDCQEELKTLKEMKDRGQEYIYV